MTGEAKRFVLSNPGFMLKKVLYGSWMFWFLGSSTSLTLLAFLINGFLLILGIRGFLQNSRSPHAWLLMALVLYWMVLHAVLFATARYSLAAAQAMMPLAATSLVRWIPWERNRRFPDATDPLKA